MKLREILPEYHSNNIFIRTLFFKRLQIAIQLVWSKLGSGDDLKVIDLGCGEGNFLRLVEKSFRNVKTYGIDVEPEVLELKKFLRAEIKIADIRENGFPNNFFDMAFCLDVLEHFKDLEKPVREIKRILKPGGLLVVSLPTESWPYKLGRLLTKRTISEQKGPCWGSHFHNAKMVEDFLGSSKFEIVKRLLLPPAPFLSLFHIVSLRKTNQLAL